MVSISSGLATEPIAVLSPEDANERPVILLTGFEPFGESRPPNPSWEGIAELHEEDWSDFHIVAHQLPVVWGEPLKHLQKQIDQHRPVAVFSFGQGLPGSFAIESQASNLRGRIPDNAGNLPVEMKITSDGPPRFQSTFKCQEMKELLEIKGYPVRVSRQAGQYLCEETLYSLEYLRKQNPELTVAFCHVPPLNSRVGNRLVDREYVQEFVRDYLAAWETVSQKPPAIEEKATPTSAPLPQSAQKTATSKTDDSRPARTEHPELPAVKKLIDAYFKSWSDQRMRDYGNCFATGAVIQEISRSGEIYTQMKDPFVASQSSYHKTATHKAIEVPVRTDITFEANLARAVVYWKLTAGPRLQYGYDHFTLIRQNGEWKIVNLVFYAVDSREP
jgi:pyroglutamyl-peptidase